MNELQDSKIKLRVVSNERNWLLIHSISEGGGGFHERHIRATCQGTMELRHNRATCQGTMELTRRDQQSLLWFGLRELIYSGRIFVFYLWGLFLSHVTGIVSGRGNDRFIKFP